MSRVFQVAAATVALVALSCSSAQACGIVRFFCNWHAHCAAKHARGYVPLAAAQMGGCYGYGGSCYGAYGGACRGGRGAYGGGSGSCYGGGGCYGGGFCGSMSGCGGYGCGGDMVACGSGGWSSCDGGCNGGGGCVSGGCVGGGCDTNGGTYSGEAIINERVIEGGAVQPPAPIEDHSASLRRRSIHLVSQHSADGGAAFDAGVAMFRDNQYSQALGSFEAASAAEPENALYRYYAALAIYETNGAQAAEGVLQQAVELERNEPVVNWGKRMERVQGRSRLWVEKARRASGLVR